MAVAIIFCKYIKVISRIFELYLRRYLFESMNELDSLKLIEDMRIFIPVLLSHPGGYFCYLASITLYCVY